MTNFFPVNPVPLSQYALGAQLLFAVGLGASLFMILLAFRLWDFHNKRESYSLMTGIGGFSLGMIAAMLLIFSMFYVEVATTPAYTITANTISYNVHQTTLTTSPLATNVNFAIVADAFIPIDIFLGFAYLFLAFIVYGTERRNKRYS
jgi:hypothetical protein